MSVEAKEAVAPADPNLVTATIDGIEVSVPKGTLIIRAAEEMNIEIPRFCDHPLLDPAGACRACIVEIPDAGNGRPMKPTPACTQPIMPGMVVETANSNETVAKHQAGMLELLLINHPLDCPICDKGGECPLQNQAVSHGSGESRYQEAKRTYPKPIKLSAQILLDRERCVLCQRCTRFSSQISGDAYINLIERGARSQIGIYEDKPYNSYFSGNVIQICPVGALTSADYRFQARPFDLVSTEVVCENCAAGCVLRTDHRHGTVRRRLAGNAPEVNEEWSCDRGRFGFKYATGEDRLRNPMVRKSGELVEVSWPEAIDAAVSGLKRAGSNVGVLTGGRLTYETAQAYSRFARVVLGTNNIDFRSRPIGADEAEFLAAKVAGVSANGQVAYRDIEKAKNVVLVSLEPEDECPILFLRLRKAWRKKGLKVYTLAALASNGSVKLGAELVKTVPGQEASALADLAVRVGFDSQTIILVGERAGLSAGTLATAAKLADETGAKLAWVPRRAGDVGAVEAGCLPNLLPGGRLVGDQQATDQMKQLWQAEALPSEPGLDISGQIEAARNANLAAMVVAGVDLRDLDDPQAAAQAIEKTFVVAIEQRVSQVTELADVVFPVATIEEQAGSFLNWEGRRGFVDMVNRFSNVAMNDIRVLSVLTEAMGFTSVLNNVSACADLIEKLGVWNGQVAKLVGGDAEAVELENSGITLASWRVLLDQARCNDNEPNMVATAPNPVVKINLATAEKLGLATASRVEVRDSGTVLVRPLQLDDQICDDVIWTPTFSGKPRKVEIFAADSTTGGVA